ncbi:MAG: S8 family peptidase [Hydrogenophaga sp.]|uniref:S8 family peptidase n=1 Tax=Hydrogenophaga sp. TaxID=1904254 RepID=UPI0025C6DFD4|nr:S8 family peptidase [Hydrogenophaga sp.]MBT9551889.1 S8 family peptidase [Hydrogenophaga sp.]
MTPRTLLVSALLSLTLPVALAQPVAGTQPSRAIAGQYIVVFKDKVSDAPGLGRQLATQLGGQYLHGYSHTIRGFSLRLPARAASAAVAALQKNPNVAYVESDATVSMTETLTSPALAQNSATWGLDRIDQVDRPLSSQYLYQYQGAGVYAFVLDTGILASHQDFGGRVQAGTGFISDGRGSTDCNGHGTHVAGTVGGGQWGVAKGATLVPVRVLDCSGSGTWSGVIAGIDWVAAQTAMRPAVANMSLGGAKSSSLNAAVAAAVGKGVTMVVAAGNSNADACNYSPASEPSAITVGATTSADARASYSNFGSCLDIFAPGSSITSAWYTGTAATQTISGTSMASPHVAGVAALALAANPASTPDMVSRFLADNASLNKVGTAGTGSPNRLVFSLAAGAPQAPVIRTVSVASIAGSSALSGRNNWVAYAQVSIRDLQGSPVSGATVTGSFAPGGSTSCVTGSAGNCRLGSSALSRAKVGFTDFTVSGVSGTALVYDANQNTTTRIRIARP